MGAHDWQGVLGSYTSHELRRRKRCLFDDLICLIWRYIMASERGDLRANGAWEKEHSIAFLAFVSGELLLYPNPSTDDIGKAVFMYE